MSACLSNKNLAKDVEKILTFAGRKKAEITVFPEFPRFARWSPGLAWSQNGCHRGIS